jgi:hypothetical protein
MTNDFIRNLNKNKIIYFDLLPGNILWSVDIWTLE